MKRGIALALIILLGCKDSKILAQQKDSWLSKSTSFLFEKLLKWQPAPKDQAAAANQNFTEKGQAEDFDFDIAYPFLVEDHLVTSALHLCGTKIGGTQLNLVNFKISKRTSGRESGLRLQVELEKFSRPAVQTFGLDGKQTMEIGLTPTFDGVENVTELETVCIHVRLTNQAGKTLHESTKQVKMLSRNDVLLAQDRWAYLATLVTPHHKLVDDLVIAAGDKLPEKKKTCGYQRDADHVYAEVKAVYDTIKALGVKYRSNTRSFLDSKELMAQRVTFPAESIVGRGANCLDGSVLFASAFESIGLQSCLVVVPGHAMVGVRLEKDSKSLLIIDTTMVAECTIEQSVAAAKKTYETHARKNEALLIDIDQCRTEGVTPFPYDLGLKTFPSDRMPTTNVPPPPVTEEKVGYSCPKCNAEFEGVPGTSVNCPGCGIALNLPRPDSTPPPVEPPAPPPTQESVEQVFDQGMDLLTARQYDKAIEIFERIYSSMPDTDMGMVSAYNAACGYSLKGEKTQALVWFETACKKGYLTKKDSCHGDGMGHAAADTDLDNIRREPRYRDLLRAYGPARTRPPRKR